MSANRTDSFLNAIFSVVKVFTLTFLILFAIFTIWNPLICYSGPAFTASVKAKISQYSSQLALYRADNGQYPNNQEGLHALINNPGNNQTWRQLLAKIDKDPWGNDYQYSFPGTKNPSSFDLWSYGADGVAGGKGENADIGNWPEAE